MLQHCVMKLYYKNKNLRSDFKFERKGLVDTTKKKSDFSGLQFRQGKQSVSWSKRQWVVIGLKLTNYDENWLVLLLGRYFLED